MKRAWRRLLAGTSIGALVLIGLPVVPMRVQAVSPTIVISQVYGGGGNSGAPLTNDYIELFNRGTSTVSLTGWSVQYTSATGTGLFSGNVTTLSGSLAPGQYYLVQEAAGATPVAPLPTADATGSIAMAATSGKVILANTASGIACNGSSTPCLPGDLAQIVDLVGYGTANFFEGAGPAPGLSNTTAAFRAAGGCTDTDNNSADFAAGAPSPRNTASTFTVCMASTLSVDDVTLNEGNAGTTTFDFSVTLSAPAGAGGVTFDIATADGTAQDGVPAGEDTDYVAQSLTGQTIPEGSTGPYTFSVTVNGDTVVEANETFFVNVTNVTGASLADGQGTGTITDDDMVLTPIHAIQGAAHTSPLAGQDLATSGIVTAKVGNGFYVQDPSPDADDATSEAMWVFTNSSPTVNVGDAIRVRGDVAEFRPGGAGTTNLTTTELTSPVVSVLSSGNPLPPTTVIGSAGRVPPTTVIEDDATPSVEGAGVFDPATDGIDFYESLEGMRVEVDNPVAVGPTNAFGEIPVLADDGAGAGLRTSRGGIIIQPGDFNPERIILDNAMSVTPAVNVGDHFTAPAIGVMDYNFGNFKLEVTSALTGVSGNLARESTAAATAGQLAVATFNVENLDPLDPPAKFSSLASLIVDNLRAPDVIAIEEAQDNNGATDNGVVDATATFNTLIAAIQAAGGPTYDFRDIDPVNDQDGGEPGGNIRVGFLFRTDRGLSFVDRAGGTSTAAVAAVNGVDGPELTFSPGRIDPTNVAFTTSRKPLAGEFLYNGEKLFVIANHFNSKSGDDPLFGRFQPPTLSSEVQREQQAAVVNNFVDSILALDPSANIITAGDFNDFQFSDALSILEGGVLHDMIDTLPLAERYSYVYDGNSQSLDHILVSDNLFTHTVAAHDVVHVNAEFAAQASDHDPQVSTFVFDSIPPDVTLSSAAPQATNTSPIPVTAQFTENVTGFTAAGITVGNGTVSNFVAVDGDTYTFDVIPAGQGVVTVDVAAGVAQDAVGNPNNAATQLTRTYDSIGPTVTIDSATGQADPTTTSPISFGVVFSEPVTGFDSADVDLSASTAPGTLSASITAVDARHYTVAVTGMTGGGTVVASIPAGVAADAATNANVGSTSTDNSVLFNMPAATTTTAPVVGTLPATGTQTGETGLWAVAVLAGGAALMLVARRRRSESESRR